MAPVGGKEAVAQKVNDDVSPSSAHGSHALM